MTGYLTFKFIISEFMNIISFYRAKSILEMIEALIFKIHFRLSLSSNLP